MADASSLVPHIKSEMDKINHEFNATPFKFNWAQELPTTKIKNNEITLDLCQQRGDWELAAAMVGNSTYRSLNVFLGHAVNAEDSDQQGCADFPFRSRYTAIYVEYEEFPPYSSHVPVFAHETGHWMGLLHPFSSAANVNQEDPCDIRNMNDFVQDTPPQLFSYETSSNDEETLVEIEDFDSCPDVLGENAIDNIMNKFCKYANCPNDTDFVFSEGQIQRMYLSWLFLYQRGEECDEETERLISISFPALNVDLVVIYDQDGNEIFNVFEIYLQQKESDLTIDFCLRRDEPYVVVVVENFRFGNFLRFEQDGEKIDWRMGGDLASFLRSFVLEPSPADTASSAENDNSMQQSTTTNVIVEYDPVKGCSPEEALLEIDDGSKDGLLNEWAWVAAFSAQEPMFVTYTEHCISRRSEPITLLLATKTSTAPYLEVRLDGETILRREWPYYELFGNYRIFSALITADMLASEEHIDTTRSGKPPLDKTWESGGAVIGRLWSAVICLSAFIWHMGEQPLFV